MIHLPWHVGVLVPARNEELLLPRCIDSVLAACALLPPTVTSDIIIAVDSSTDRTLEIADRKVYGHGAAFTTEAGVVGRTRSLAAEVALQRYTGPPHLCWLANTDADCSVPETWLLDQLSLAEQEVEAIAGIVDVDSFAEHGEGVALQFRSSYIVHADDSHPHVHGANMGMRADAYLRAGGWNSLDTAEDHDLWNRLRNTGSCHRSVARVRVLTSGRRVGRAPLGFAGALAKHNEVPSC